jgi:beta-glucosidase
MKTVFNYRLVVLMLVAVVTLSPINAAFAAQDKQQKQQRQNQTSTSAEQRTESLLKQMTLEDKIALVTGNVNNYYGFYNSPIEKLGIPALTMADGPAGVRVANPDVQGKKSTALPVPIALAATWDTNAAQRYGDLIGQEAWNTTHNVVLGPGFDIARLPWGARNFESLGEDPLLQSRMGVAYVQGIQSNPVIAVGKHYLLNNQETERFTYNAVASERAIMEVYSRPFAAAAQEADLGGVMCSFNQVNGKFGCENPTLLTDILKNKLGFNGLVMSDYGANLTTVESALAGLDLETPGDPYGFWGDKLLAAVKNGQVSQAVIDDKVRRILVQMYDKGLFDKPVQNNLIPAKQHGKVARELAEQSMVLLQNKSNALPLNAGKLKSIAVIGPDADNASAAGGGGSSLVNPTYTVSPLEGIRARAGKNIQVKYAQGSDGVSTADLISGPSAIPSSLLSSGGAANETGLKAEYWTNANFEGQPSLVRNDPQVNLNLGFFNFEGFNTQSPKVPVTPGDFNNAMSARWTGEFTAPKTGEYELSLTSLGSGQLFLNDQPLIDNKGVTLTTSTAKISLTQGEKRTVRIEYRTDSPDHVNFLKGAQIRFGWKAPEGTIDPLMQKAVELASKSDVAVVVTRTYESEGWIDRLDLQLPNNQEELVRAVAAVNPRTIVVQMSGRAVQMDKWQNNVEAIVQAWYAGQEQGNAIAHVLFGDVNPSGKLPVTFPVNENQTPVSSQAQFPGVNGVVDYSEGIYVGYRGYEKLGIAPAFAFGHGLSYTTFDYRNLKASATKSGTVQVTLNLRNTGDRTGSEVVQVYTGKLPGTVDTPSKQLAGFAKVELKPGKQQQVTLNLDAKALSYWDEAKDQWVMPAGKVPLYVGSSSQDIRLTGSVTVYGQSGSGTTDKDKEQDGKKDKNNNGNIDDQQNDNESNKKRGNSERDSIWRSTRD